MARLSDGNVAFKALTSQVSCAVLVAWPPQDLSRAVAWPKDERMRSAVSRPGIPPCLYGCCWPHTVM
jgi:hypothetical protein